MTSKLFGILLILAPINVLGQLIISSGAYMIQSGGHLVVMNNWVNDGTFTPTGGTVYFGDTATMGGTAALDSFNNLTIQTGSILTILANNNVSVAGTFTNSVGNTGLVLQSTVAGSASLIHNTAGVGATVQRYMNANRWHNISSSVAGQDILAFLTNASNNVPQKSPNYGMEHFSESANAWVYFPLAPDPAENFTLGAGYMVRHTSDDAVSLLGTLNTTDPNISVTKTGISGWNSVGNPFPCSLGANNAATTSENFLTYNAITNSNLDPTFAALYLWDEPASRVSGVSYFKIITNSGFISSTGREVLSQAYMQPGQGFIIRALATGTVSFTTGMRAHENTGSYFKSAKISWPGMTIIASSATKTASTAVTFYPGMTRGLDVTYDAGLMGGDPAFKLYSRLVTDNGNNFMLQCLPDNNFTNMSIPLGFDCTAGGLITFTAEATPLPAGCRAILEDRLLGKFTDLEPASSAYSTTLSANSAGIGRFYLHAFDIATDIQNSVSPSFNIYAFKKEIFIEGYINGDTHANLYDISGRLIKNYELAPVYKNILPASDIPNGVYVIKIFGKSLNVNKKIMLE